MNLLHVSSLHWTDSSVSSNHYLNPCPRTRGSEVNPGEGDVVLRRVERKRGVKGEDTTAP